MMKSRVIVVKGRAVSSGPIGYKGMAFFALVGFVTVPVDRGSK
jgi:hypothetical protein